MNKRVLSVILVLAMIVSLLTGCGGASASAADSQ